MRTRVRIARGVAAAALTAVLAALPAGAGGREDTMELHREAIVFDAHCDTAMRLLGERAVDLGARLPDGHIDLVRAGEGGLDAQIFAVWVPPFMPPAGFRDRAERMIDAIKAQAAAHADRMEIALDGRDVKRIVKRGKLAAIIGIEGAHALGDDPGALRAMYDRGVRCLTVTWSNTNAFADAADDTARWGGLSESGRALVREMDRLGMAIDLSHVSDATLFAVLAETKRPVIVSHSCMRALCDIPRNVSDEAMRAVAKRGGVICVNFYAGFLEKAASDSMSAILGRYRARAAGLAPQFGGNYEAAWRCVHDEFEREAANVPSVPLARLVDHIDHAVRVAGIDHVGLGSDFDGISATPIGLEDASKLPAITEELRRRGYSDRDIRKILGGNLLRVIEKVVR